MPVVFLHPIGLDGSSWSLLNFGGIEDPVLYDLLWHGGRPKPAEALSLSAFAADVVANVPGDLDLVGLSMGGGVALEIAVTFPTRVRSLILVATSAGGTGDEGRRTKAEMVERAGIESVLDETIRRWFTIAAIESGNRGVDMARQSLLQTSPEVMAASWRALIGNDRWLDLAHIAAPTTLVRPESDNSASPAILQRMAATMPSARLRLIPGPHMVHLEEPELFSDVVREHLSWVQSL